MKRFRPEWTPERIRRLRYHCGLTQQKMAEELGVCHQKLISLWETGSVCRPQRAKRLALTRLALKANFYLEELQQ